MKMRRFVPPAGVPLSTKEVFTALLRTPRFSNGSRDEELHKLGLQLKVQYVYGISSGRAALWLILKTLHRLNPDRDIVAVPAYTCFSVPAAIVRAGLRVHLIDINPGTLDFEPSALSALPEKRLLCVITSNLFGLPNDLSAVTQAAHSRGAFVIDDAAQAFGAIRDGRLAGTCGDVGIYSLGRGKALSALEGGIIVTNSEVIGPAIKNELKAVRKPSILHGTRLVLETFIYSVFINPSLYRIPDSLPFLKLGVTEFNPSFQIDELHPFCEALLAGLLGSIVRVNQIRQANAVALTEALMSMRRFEVPKPPANTFPTFVRLPVIAQDKNVRERAVRQLRSAGIGASRFYPTAICDIPELESYMAFATFHQRQAEALSERLFTLPVNPLLSINDRNRIIGVLATI
jgi:perosamine synthetase